jgi:hypothetical protein
MGILLANANTAARSVSEYAQAYVATRMSAGLCLPTGAPTGSGRDNKYMNRA